MAFNWKLPKDIPEGKVWCPVRAGKCPQVPAMPGPCQNPANNPVPFHRPTGRRRHMRYPQHPGWASTASRWVKRAKCRKPLTVWLYFDSTLKRTEVQTCHADSWLLGLGSRRGVAVTIKMCKRNRGMEFFWILTALGVTQTYTSDKMAGNRLPGTQTESMRNCWNLHKAVGFWNIACWPWRCGCVSSSAVSHSLRPHGL